MKRLHAGMQPLWYYILYRKPKADTKAVRAEPMTNLHEGIAC